MGLNSLILAKTAFRMSRILATAGSNSSTSINFSLIQHTAATIPDHSVEVLELAGYPIPMYSEDLEESHGIPGGISELKSRIQGAGALILSVNEHNGNPSAFFKNILDWLSRDERKFLEGIPVLLMSASGGKRGGISSRNVVEQMLGRFGAEVVSTFSLQSFYESFDPEKGITDPEQERLHREALGVFLTRLSAIS
jgi:NAD(P)H-dependent FMN reductase